MYWFSDGLFVVDALSPYEDLIGARVDAINGHPIDDVLAAVEPLVPRDNYQQVLSESPRLMAVTEVLHGLGILDAGNVATEFTLTADGETTDVTVEPVVLGVFEQWSGGHHTLSPATATEWTALADQRRRRHLVADRSRYATLPTSATTWSTRIACIVASDLSIAMDAGEFDALVVDLRHNPGGNNTTYGALLGRRAACRRGADRRRLPGDQPGHVLSRGQLLDRCRAEHRRRLRRRGHGQQPEPVRRLPGTDLAQAGLRFRVALRYWEKSTPSDPRITIEPDMEVLLSSSDYFGDVDPVMNAILGALD